MLRCPILLSLNTKCELDMKLITIAMAKDRTAAIIATQ
jgi:hypothetical protein